MAVSGILDEFQSVEDKHILKAVIFLKHSYTCASRKWLFPAPYFDVFGGFKIPTATYTCHKCCMYNHFTICHTHIPLPIYSTLLMLSLRHWFLSSLYASTCLPSLLLLSSTASVCSILLYSLSFLV